ncbi:MAG: hypothetical protein ACFHHU_00535 [Porticoccaceae bacterium]
MEILVVLALFVLALFFINRWKRGKEIGGRISNTINTLGKIQSLISLFKSYLTEDALRNDEDVAYYLSYLRGVVEELCKYDQQECDLVQMTPIYQEVHRLGCLESDQIFEEGREVLLRLIKTPDGQQGLEDGMSDGAYMANPKNPAPYFGNLISRFNIPTA